MERYADISHNGRYRWSLIRRWAEGPAVCWIMLNPSTADEQVDDPTIRSVVARSKGWGFGAAVVVNLYQIRSSDPKRARHWAAVEREPNEMRVNLAGIRECARRCDRIIAAWGAHPWARPWASVVVDVLRAEGRQVWCLGKTKSGAPIHPLARGRHRVPVEQEPVLL